MAVKMKFQLAFFVIYGLLSGVAFSIVLDDERNKAKNEGVSEVLIRLPLKALVEIGI
jgi:hypothetical protein